MTNEGIELDIYSYSAPAGTKLATIISRVEPQFLEEIGSVGGGTFMINRNDAQLIKNPALLESRNIIKYKVDGTVIGAWVITEREVVTISEGEYAGEYYKVSGMGLKSWLDDAIVAPLGGFKTTSKDTRSFSFASEEGSWYVPANWIAPISTGQKAKASKYWNYGPEKWPGGATQAMWVWGTANAHKAAALGDNYFRIKLPISTAGTYALYLAGDDTYAVYVDGERIAETEYEVGNWKEAKKLTFNLTTGTHTVGIRVSNLKAIAGLIAAVYRVIDRVPDVSVGTVTIAVGVDALLTRTAHGLTNNTKVYLTTTGTLPTGLQPNVDYYVRDASANTFRLAKSAGGPAIDTSGSQSGTHTILRQEIAETQKLVTYSGMSTAALTTAVNNASATVTTKLNDYNALPAGNPSGNNTEKKQASAKATALAAYQKAVQNRDALQRELTASSAADAAGITWRVMPYPANAPGWTPGEILLTLINEASARSVANMSLITPNFTGALDSNGVAWTDRLEWTFDVGKDTLLSVAQKMEELVCDVWIDPTTFQLNVANSRGVDRSIYKYDVDGISVLSSPILFKRGKNLRSASIKFRGKVKNSLAIKGNTGWFAGMTNDSTSVTKYGILEGSLDTAASKDISNKLASQIFKQKAIEEEGASYDVYLPPSGIVPHLNFKVGDWVLAPNYQDISVKRRVMSIATTEGTNGRPLYTIEFDTIFRTNEDRINKVIQKLGGGGVGSSTSNAGGVGSSSPSAPVILPGGGSTEMVDTDELPDQPTDLDIFSIGQWSVNGVTPYAEVSLTWSPVITNTDGSETVPSYYEVWGYPTLDGPVAALVQATVTEPKATMQPYGTGINWTFWVVAYNSPDRPSAPSESISHTMAAPTEPMPAPTAPTLTSSNGLLIVSWDGLMVGSNPPPTQFRYIYTEVSPNGTTGWTRAGSAFTRDARSMSLPGYAVGSNQYARFTAVDGVGIESPKSAVAGPRAIVGVDLGDLDAEVSDAIDAANTAAAAAQDAANDAVIAAGAAQTQANLASGKITVSTAAPVVGDGTGKVAGSIWWQTTGGNIVGQWEWTGSAWSSRPLDNAVIATLDAAKINTGTLAAARIAAGSISTSKLMVTNLENFVEDGSFEYSATSGVAWTLTNGATIGTTAPRTGTRHLICPTGVNLHATSVAAFAVEATEQYRIEAWVRLSSGTAVTTGVILRFTYGATEASTTTTTADIALTTEGTTTTYTKMSGIWTVPAGAKWARVQVVQRDATASLNYYVDDIAVYKMATGSLIVDGAITAVKIAAQNILAEHLGANSVAAANIQAGAVVAGKIATDAITANEIAAGAIDANAIQAGAIQVNHLSPAVGTDLNIEGNVTIASVQSSIAGVQGDVDATNSELEEMTTFYSFGPNGAVISQPGSVFATAVRSDRIEMLENGNVVSYWNSGTMYVNQFVGTKVTMGNHQIEQFGTGTVVRALG